MRYFYNYESDVVVREDENGDRYIKWLDDPSEERKTSKECKEAWGIPSYGFYNMLFTITKELYDTFGIEWEEIYPPKNL